MDSQIIRILKIVDLNEKSTGGNSLGESMIENAKTIGKFDYVQVDDKIISVVLLGAKESKCDDSMEAMIADKF